MLRYHRIVKIVETKLKGVNPEGRKMLDVQITHTGASAGSFAGCIPNTGIDEQSLIVSGFALAGLSGGGDAGVVSSNHRRQPNCNLI